MGKMFVYTESTWRRVDTVTYSQELVSPLGRQHPQQYDVDRNLRTMENRFGASLLSCHWTLVHLDHRAEERKMSYGQIIRQKHIENEKKNNPFLRLVIPRVLKRLFLLAFGLSVPS